jgi:hypothetical protein
MGDLQAKEPNLSPDLKVKQVELKNIRGHTRKRNASPMKIETRNTNQNFRLTQTNMAVQKATKQI